MMMPAELKLFEGQSKQRFNVPIKDSAFLQVGAAFLVNLVDVQLANGTNLSLFNIRFSQT